MYSRLLVMDLLWTEKMYTVDQLAVLYRKAEGRKYGLAILVACIQRS